MKKLLIVAIVLVVLVPLMPAKQRIGAIPVPKDRSTGENLILDSPPALRGKISRRSISPVLLSLI